MRLRAQLELKLIRASAKELHHRSVERARERRQALEKYRRYPTIDGGLARAEMEFVAAHHSAQQMGQCHRLWSLLRAWSAGKAYKDVETPRLCVDHARGLAYELGALVTEACFDPTIRTPRNTSAWKVYNAKTPASLLACEAQDVFKRWIAVDAVTLHKP